MILALALFLFELQAPLSANTACMVDRFTEANALVELVGDRMVVTRVGKGPLRLPARFEDSAKIQPVLITLKDGRVRTGLYQGRNPSDGRLYIVKPGETDWSGYEETQIEIMEFSRSVWGNAKPTATGESPAAGDIIGGLPAEYLGLNGYVILDRTGADAHLPRNRGHVLSFDGNAYTVEILSPAGEKKWRYERVRLTSEELKKKISGQGGDAANKAFSEFEAWLGNLTSEERMRRRLVATLSPGRQFEFEFQNGRKVMGTLLGIWVAPDGLQGDVLIGGGVGQFPLSDIKAFRSVNQGSKTPTQPATEGRVEFVRRLEAQSAKNKADEQQGDAAAETLLNVRGEALRRHPPAGDQDTMMFHVGTGEARGFKDVRATFIQPSEIIEYHPFSTSREILAEEGSVPIFGGNSGRFVLQQQGFRGCTAAATGMLILDSGGTPDVYSLRNRQLAGDLEKVGDLERAGLRPIVTALPSWRKDLTRKGPLTLEQKKIFIGELAAMIKANGSAIVSVDGEVGGHVIVVDAIDLAKQSARIRDPYHGWEITIRLEALQKRLTPSSPVIQIQRDARGMPEKR